MGVLVHPPAAPVTRALANTENSIPSSHLAPTPRTSRSTTKNPADAIRILPIKPASPPVNSFTTAAMGSPQLSLDAVLMSPPLAQDNLAVDILDRGNTLSSTIVGVGAHNNAIPPHYELVGFPSHSGELFPSASRAKNQDDRCDRRRSKSRCGPNLREGEQSVSNHRAASTTAKGREPLSRSPRFERNSPTEKELSSERVNMFLQSMGQGPNDTEKGLLAENRGLYRRVAALQRVERELLAENHIGSLPSDLDAKAAPDDKAGALARRVEEEGRQGQGVGSPVETDGGNMCSTARAVAL